MYPLVLRLEVFVGVGRKMSGFREGRETTITAVLISAVHHASAVRLGLGGENFGMISGGSRVERCIGDKAERLTARSIIDGVVRCGIYDEAAEADDDRDEAKGENTNQADLLTPAELEAIDDEEWEAKD
jgi:hypothetical protein